MTIIDTPASAAGTAPAHTRSEHDLLGDRDIPAGAYWGVHTLRAVENFPITGQKLSSNMHLVRGLAAVKLAAARTNRELGLLDAERSDAIEQAARTCWTANSPTSSWWTSSRAAPGRRRT